MAAHVPQLQSNRTAALYQVVRESAPIRALVVDDSPDVLEVICALLEMEGGIEIVGRASNGSQALEAVGCLHPDLVVMDMQMPCMDGLTAAKLMRVAFPETSIVLMSADPGFFDRNEVLATGAEAFIDKIEFARVFPGVLAKLTTSSQMPM
jgi:CheY-like chemotaxis protein